MSLLVKIKRPENVAKDRDFYEMQESHIEYIKKNTTEYYSVTALQAAIYRGDFYGLLDSLGVEKKYQYLIMRVNGLNCSSDFNGEKIDLLKPPMDIIGRIMVIYSSIET